MNKVVTINLNGRAYQIEENGYNDLKNYLDQAATKLHENPDKEEIIADLEQAIADKCDHYLNPNKTVMEVDEIKKILEEMGPVNDGAAEKTSEHKKENSSEKNAPKKLYLIREGAMIAGVCNGLAAYFNVDVTLVRVIFVILTLLTQGGWILVYFILSMLIPYANTSEEKAAAHGEIFNTEELIARAKARYGKFDKKYWRSQKRYWKHWAKNYSKGKEDWAKNYSKWKEDWAKNSYQYQYLRTGVGFGAVIFGIIVAAFSLIWVMSIISLIATGALFGFVFIGIPVWVMIVIISILFSIILAPFRTIRGAIRNPYYYNNGILGLLDGLIWLGFLAVLIWLLWTFVPQSHGVWETISNWWGQLFSSLK